MINPNDMIKHTKQLIILVIGTSVLLIGIALIVLPGPAFIVIPVGLAILATEFLWARKLLNSVKKKINYRKLKVLNR